MTTKKRAKPEHLQKLTALFERYDSLNMKQVLTELQTSVVNAQAALDELGAVKQGAKWVLVDDESAPVEVAPGAKAEIEQSVEPPSNPAELPEPETVAVIEALDWENAPEGATHYSVITGAYYSYAGGLVHFKDGQWEKSGGCFQEMQRSVGVIVRPTSTENPADLCPRSDRDQPKAKSDYSPVFDNIKGRVLSTIKAHNGATADRVRELTGMHPDDIEDAVQFMVDHGQLIGREVYFATVYEVAA